jgi:hypothetical protein
MNAAHVPSRLALPVRHALCLRRMPSELSWRETCNGRRGKAPNFIFGVLESLWQLIFDCASAHKHRKYVFSCIGMLYRYLNQVLGLQIYTTG